jgi:hypothetical protein
MSCLCIPYELRSILLAENIALAVPVLLVQKITKNSGPVIAVRLTPRTCRCHFIVKNKVILRDTHFATGENLKDDRFCSVYQHSQRIYLKV